ncbi:hypothetical protein BaRGS_00000137, partial [Batillaria attramentaria]
MRLLDSNSRLIDTRQKPVAERNIVRSPVGPGKAMCLGTPKIFLESWKSWKGGSVTK